MIAAAANFIFPPNFFPKITKLAFTFFLIKSLVNFNNNVKDDPMDLAQTLAINCYTYDIKDIYKGDLFFLEYNEKHIKDLHKVLNFDKGILVLFLTLTVLF
jgi:hypothetical protein